MSLLYKCDVCGAPGFIYPKSEYQYEDKVTIMEVPNPKDPLTRVKKSITQQVPKTKRMRRQNVHTGEVELFDVPDTLP